MYGHFQAGLKRDGYHNRGLRERTRSGLVASAFQHSGGAFQRRDPVVMDFHQHRTVAMQEELRQLGLDIGPGEFAPRGARERW